MCLISGTTSGMNCELQHHMTVDQWEGSALLTREGSFTGVVLSHDWSRSTEWGQIGTCWGHRVTTGAAMAVRSGCSVFPRKAHWLVPLVGAGLHACCCHVGGQTLVLCVVWGQLQLSRPYSSLMRACLFCVLYGANCSCHNRTHCQREPASIYDNQPNDIQDEGSCGQRHFGLDALPHLSVLSEDYIHSIHGI